MKKIIILIFTLVSTLTYSQTMTIRNLTTGSTFNFQDIIDMDCSGNQNFTIASITPGVSTFITTLGQFPKVNIEHPFIPGTYFSLYTQDSSLCGYNSGTPSSAFVGGFTFVWTDLGGGDVQIDIF